SVAAPLGRESRFVVAVRPALAWASQAQGAVVCARAPIAATRTTAAQRDAIRVLRTSAVALAGRLTLVDSAAWRLTVQGRPCSAADSAQRSDSGPRPTGQR
ncbi:MAG: hypothetical protein ABI205_10315, partial [Gemmatimonadaceae bacterium]